LEKEKIDGEEIRSLLAASPTLPATESIEKVD
jgi:hypothetical protein